MAELIVEEFEWARLTIDPDAKRVTLLERWGYQWTLAPGVEEWTSGEQHMFHAVLQEALASTFKGITLTLRGSAGLARAAPRMALRLEVSWSREEFKHWTAIIRKMPAGSDPTAFISHVDRRDRIVYLDSADVNDRLAVNDAHKTRKFNSLPHEFVHTLGRGSSNTDEYNAGSPFLGDTDSAMNIGTHLRRRHLEMTLDALNTMVPNCTFSFP
jgi:hypothetical protein